MKATRKLLSLDEQESFLELYYKIIDEFRLPALKNEEKQDALVCYLFHNFPIETVCKWFDFPFEP